MLMHTIDMSYPELGPGGMIHLKIPDDGSGSAYVSFLHHMQKMAELDPTAVVDAMSAENREELLGDVEYSGGYRNPEDGSMRGSLGRWEDRVEAKAGRRTPKERALMARGVGLGKQPAPSPNFHPPMTERAILGAIFEEEGVSPVFVAPGAITITVEVIDSSGRRVVHTNKGTVTADKGVVTAEGWAKVRT